MIYDIILIAIFALFIFIGVRRGAAASLAGMLISFVSYAAATFLGRLISVNVYNLIIKPTVHDTVVSTVSDFSNRELNNALSNLDFGSLDVLGMQDSVKSSITDTLSEPIENISASAGSTAESVVEPIVLSLMSFFITIFLFVLIFFLLRKFVTPLFLRAFKFPVVKQVNAVLGGVIGAAEAFLLVCMLAYLLKLIVSNFNSDAWLLQESTIYKSFIFKYLYDGNIFSIFASLIPV